MCNIYIPQVAVGLLGGMQESRAETDPDKLRVLIEGGKDAADFLKTYVVQAKLNDRGNYGESVFLPYTMSIPAVLAINVSFGRAIQPEDMHLQGV